MIRRRFANDPVVAAGGVAARDPIEVGPGRVSKNILLPRHMPSAPDASHMRFAKAE